MRISDWSSDVCSSDLSGRYPRLQRSKSDLELRLPESRLLPMKRRDIAPRQAKGYSQALDLKLYQASVQLPVQQALAIHQPRKKGEVERVPNHRATEQSGRESCRERGGQSA